jgi:hypothetical protein
LTDDDTDVLFDKWIEVMLNRYCMIEFVFINLWCFMASSDVRGVGMHAAIIALTLSRKSSAILLRPMNYSQNNISEDGRVLGECGRPRTALKQRLETRMRR